MIVELPLSAVPAPAKRSILAPSVTSPGGARLQVLRALSEPRPISLGRFLSYRLPTGEVVSHPFESDIRGAFEGKEAAALAVYVRVEGPTDISAPDPLTSLFDARLEASRGWTPLTVVAAENGLRLPCAPPTIPSGDSLMIAPPEPAYPAAGVSLIPGEVREGWLLCLSLADHSGHATLKWVFSGASETEVTAPAWAPLARMPAGAWPLIEEGTVLGWNEDEQAEVEVEPPAPSPSRFPAPTSEIPESGTEIVYRGPVWISIGTEISYRRDPASAGDSLGSIFHAQHVPGDCPGVAVWYRDRGVDCAPSGADRFGRLAVQIAFPGLEEAQAEWEHLALADRLSLDLYVEDSPDGLFGTVEGIEVQARGTWIEADLPGETMTVWASLKSADGVPTGPMPVWELSLDDAATERVDTRQGVCRDHACFDADELSLLPTDLTNLQLDMPVPLMAIGRSGHGLTPRTVRRVPGEILVNDNLHGQDFLPRRLSDPWLLIDIATVTDRAQRSFLVYPDGAGGYETGPLEMVHYYEGSSGPIVVRYDAHAETRRGDEGFALLGTLPAGVPNEEVFLVMANTGPAWRLK